MIGPFPPVHPGEVLRQEFLEPLALTPYALAKAVNVPRTRIERLTKCETSVTADTALRLARYFGTSAELWMNLQTTYDLTQAAISTGTAIEAIAPRAA
jgi:addiction module HigA family antidote